MSVSYATKIHLAMRSGNRCAMPECDRDLSEGDFGVVGVAAHIAGAREGGARFDSSMTPEERNGVDNLIYLCRECHAKIDSPHGQSEYPVARLLAMKAAHEQKVDRAMDKALAEVAFPEIGVATKWISQVSPKTLDQDYSRVPLDAKIRRNDLSTPTRNLIAAHLGVAPQVRSFVQLVSQEDPNFPARLKDGFLARYHELRRDEIGDGDELFTSMLLFARQGVRDLKEQCAAQAVLIYLFEICEVFEQ